MKKNRIVPIISITLMLLLVSLTFGQETKKYPPYPDVWGYEFPWPGNEDRYSAIDIKRIANGDYIATYVSNRKEIIRKDGSCCDYINKYEGVSFFSGKIFPEDEYKTIPRENVRTSKKIIMDGGNIIEQISIATSGSCSDPFYDYYIIKKDSKGKIVEKKMLLYFYAKPKKTDINRYCERNNSYKKDYFFKSVENVYVKFCPLEDGTFFVYDPEGNFIIRFDENFNTKTPLINKRIFLINRLDYEKIYNRQAKEGKINDQQMNDAIANYILDLRKEGDK